VIKCRSWRQQLREVHETYAGKETASLEGYGPGRILLSEKTPSEDNIIDFSMNIPSINPSLAGLRGNRLTIGIVVFGILTAYALSTYIVRDDMYTLALIALGIAASVVVLIILTNWRTGLMIFFFWLLFEDLARKYLGNNMAVYFGKDLLVVVCYLSFFWAIKRQKIRAFKPPFHVPLLVMICFGAMQVFNPASPSIFYGLMGFKLFFLYVPLMFLGYALASSEEDLRRFFFP